jgi:hypothetical protein
MQEKVKKIWKTDIDSTEETMDNYATDIVGAYHSQGKSCSKRQGVEGYNSVKRTGIHFPFVKGSFFHES